jgi:hypothetical protein
VTECYRIRITNGPDLTYLSSIPISVALVLITMIASVRIVEEATPQPWPRTEVAAGSRVVVHGEQKTRRRRTREKNQVYGTGMGSVTCAPIRPLPAGTVIVCPSLALLVLADEWLGWCPKIPVFTPFDWVGRGPGQERGRRRIPWDSLRFLQSAVTLCPPGLGAAEATTERKVVPFLLGVGDVRVHTV